jgi:hypothetical protein
VHDAEYPTEIFLRLKGSDCSSELIGLYDVIARLMSLALQYGGAPLEKVGDLLARAKCVLCGPVVGRDPIKHCASLQEIIGQRQTKHRSNPIGHDSSATAVICR